MDGASAPAFCDEVDVAAEVVFGLHAVRAVLDKDPVRGCWNSGFRARVVTSRFTVFERKRPHLVYEPKMHPKKRWIVFPGERLIRGWWRSTEATRHNA